MIKSFANKNTEALFLGYAPKGFNVSIARTAYRKLKIVNAATSLHDLRQPPGNRLEALKDDRKGQHSIRINDQWRICFVWRDNNAYDVEIVDYH